MKFIIIVFGQIATLNKYALNSNIMNSRPDHSYSLSTHQKTHGFDMQKYTIISEIT